MTNRTHQPDSKVRKTSYVYKVDPVTIGRDALVDIVRRSRESVPDPIAEAVADYYRRIETGEAYEDAMSADAFHAKYLS